MSFHCPTHGKFDPFIDGMCECFNNCKNCEEVYEIATGTATHCDDCDRWLEKHEGDKMDKFYGGEL